jgi:pimeloyl-ACP methyl ester carboxylesterase
VVIANTRTRALELPAGRAPLLLLHGFSDSADTWRPVLALLASAQHRARAVDLPGFGHAARLRSDQPILEQLDRFARAALQELAEETGEQVIVAGNSLGGLLALRLAEHADLPVAGVVALAPAGLETPRWFSRIAGHPLVRLVTSSYVPLPPFVVRTAIGAAYRQLGFASPGNADPVVVRTFGAHYRSFAEVRRMIETGRRLLPELTSPYRLAKVTVPVLLIWGEGDKMLPPRGAQLVLDALPQASHYLLPGCGHCPQVEQPDVVVDLLKKFDHTASPA